MVEGGQRRQTVTLIAITGGAGFLGGHLARRFVGSGLPVRVLDTAPEPAWAQALGVTYVNCDVRDARQVRRATDGAQVLVHAAFASPRSGPVVMHGVNVTGTANVLDAATEGGIDRVVLISSTIVDKGPRWVGPLRRTGLARLNVYRRTRVLAEESASAYRRDGIPVAVVRPKTFVGPDRLGAFAIVFELVRRGSSVVIPGAGRNRYQLLDIRDFATGVELLARRGGDGLYCFGAQEFGTVTDDLDQLIRHAGTGATVQRLPAVPARIGLRAAELAGVPPFSEWYHCASSGQDSVVDISRSVNELGWTPARSNTEALADAYDWFLDIRSKGGSAATTHPVPLVHRLLSSAARVVLR